MTPCTFLYCGSGLLFCFCVWSTTNVTFLSLLEFLFIFITHFQWFIKMPSCCFFAAINFFFSCHEFIDSIFSSVYLNWLAVFVIITTNYFITISIVCLFLVCFSVWFIIVYCLVQMCESQFSVIASKSALFSTVHWIPMYCCLYQVFITLQSVSCLLSISSLLQHCKQYMQKCILRWCFVLWYMHMWSLWWGHNACFHNLLLIKDSIHLQTFLLIHKLDMAVCFHTQINSCWCYSAFQFFCPLNRW